MDGRYRIYTSIAQLTVSCKRRGCGIQLYKFVQLINTYTHSGMCKVSAKTHWICDTNTFTSILGVVYKKNTAVQCT